MSQAVEVEPCGEIVENVRYSISKGSRSSSPGTSSPVPFRRPQTTNIVRTFLAIRPGTESQQAGSAIVVAYPGWQPWFPI